MSVTVPFKQDEKWLYDIIASHSSKSAFIKDTLKEALKNDTVSKEKSICKESTQINTDNFLDF